MLQVGKVKKYNEARGFGFIEVEETKQELFFHIKDFPKAKVPQVGERLTFSTQQYENKLKAVNIVRLDFPNQQQKSRPKSNFRDKEEKSSIFGTILAIGFVSIVVYFIYGFITDAMHRSELASLPPVSIETSSLRSTETMPLAQKDIQQNKSSFNCDGRVHCSQMSSKAEADWFVANCPGTRMDGDNDGNACENDSRW